MLRRLLLIAAVAVAFLVIALLIAASLIDPKGLVEPLVADYSAQIERPVALGEIDFSLLPIPAVRVRAVRVGGTAPEAPPLVAIDEVRVRVAVFPLLLGRVVLRAIHIDSPRVHLELDADGRLIIPGAGQSEEVAGEVPASNAGAGKVPALAIQAIKISDGSFVAGPWEVTNIRLRGRLHLDRSAELGFDADLPGLALLRDGRVALQGIGSDELAANASVVVEDGDLSGIGARLELAPVLEGRLDGPVAVSIGGDELRGARVELSATKLHVISGDLELQGDASVDAETGGPFEVDLSRCRIAAGEVFEKPDGVEASISGDLGARADMTALQNVLVTLGTNRVQLGLELGADPAKVRIEPTTLDLEPLAQVIRTGLDGLSGRVKLNSWQITPEPLTLSGSAELMAVALTLQHGPVLVSGPLSAEGTWIRGRDIRVVAGDQAATVSGGYDIGSRRLSLEGSLTGAELEALGQALAGSTDLVGLLNGRLSVKGPPELEGLAGTGGFEITNGKIRGFSLLEQFLGDLAGLPILVAQLKGKDLSRYQEEEFRRLAADVRLRSGKLHTENLTLEYRHSTAYLHGSVGILDGALDLGGRVVISEELDAAIAGEAAGRSKEFRIEGITGTVSRPRVRVDRRTLAALAAGYAGQGRVREALEEKLGKEGTEAVQDLLEQILRGEGR